MRITPFPTAATQMSHCVDPKYGLLGRILVAFWVVAMQKDPIVRVSGSPVSFSR